MTPRPVKSTYLGMGQQRVSVGRLEKDKTQLIKEPGYRQTYGPSRAAFHGVIAQQSPPSSGFVSAFATIVSFVLAMLPGPLS